MKKAVLLAFALVLFSILTTVDLVGPVEATGTIFIRADGSIEGTTHISTVDNVTYTFTGNINDEIVVERDNIVIDGNGHTLQGFGSGNGIYVNGTNNVTIKNMEIKEFQNGVWLNMSSNSKITWNNITNNFHGVIVWGLNNSVNGNNITNNRVGILLHESSNTTVTGNNLNNHFFGILLGGSSKNTLSKNNITNHGVGVLFLGSSNNTVTGNNITNNQDGIMLSGSLDNSIAGNTFVNCGLSVTDSYRNLVVDNWVNGKPLVYLEGVSDYTVEDAGQVILVNCSRILVENLDLSSANVGVQLWGTKNSEIAGNNITNCKGGVYLGWSSNDNRIYGNNLTANNFGIQLHESSNNNSVYGNDITENDIDGIILNSSSSNSIYGNTIIDNNQWGVGLYSSNNNSIHGNNIVSNPAGIRLSSSSNNNSLYGNNLTANSYGIALYENSSNNSMYGNDITEKNSLGIYLHNSSSNSITENNIADNYAGIKLRYSSNNIIYHNNLAHNREQVGVSESTNVWDNGFEGNFWSNYTGVDSDHDGIGDITHVIDANNTDNYPLMGMFQSFNTPLEYNVNVISNSSIEDFEYFEFNSTIIMHVSNMTANQTFGFCRVSIPISLMSPPYTVMINDGLTEVLYFNDTVYDNSTYRWLYFAYEHSTHKIAIIPEFSTWTSMLLILIVLTVTVVIYKRRLLKTPKH